VRVCLDAGLPVDTTLNVNGMCALHYAACFASDTLFIELLNRGATPNKPDYVRRRVR